MVEMSSASAGPDQGAGGAGARAGVRTGAGTLALREPREAIRRSVALAVSKA